MDPIAHRKHFPNKNPKGNKRSKISRKIFFEEPSIDWGHRSDSLGIDELVCFHIIDLLDEIWYVPLWLELALRLVHHDDGPPDTRTNSPFERRIS